MIPAYSGQDNSAPILQVSIIFAVAAHLFLILGVGFEIPRPTQFESQAMDIILVTPVVDKTPPKDPKLLAATSQTGGGEKVVETPPASKPSKPAVIPKPEPTPELQRSSKPEPEQAIKQEVITTQEATTTTVSEPKKEKRDRKKNISLNQLLASTQQEIELLTANIEKRNRIALRRDRRKPINASTQELKYANYMDAWRKKVERIGNLNYPNEAKRRKLYGDLLMQVAIRTDGTIESIRIVRSSGHKVLDDAAKRIVELAAPFQKFPPDILKDHDILDINNTWLFQNGDRLHTR